ncbi:MAG: synthase, partial [Rickettsiaceae bacterium]|nr:synthase [Rickettsiaceae bacterium]
MTSKLTISTAQLNFTVGDLEGNKAKIIAAHKKAKGEGADLVVFSEMAITGYPPEDLVLRPDFQLKAVNVIRELAPFTSNGTAMLVGGLWQEPDGKIYNAAALLDEGEIKHITCKNDLPNYGVFDEKRVFAAAPLPEPLEFRGVKLGVMICEDLWNATTSKHLKKKGAEILISLNASPFEVSKSAARLEIARKNVSINNLPLIYVNQIGGQDELVFDGGSFILDKRGKMLVKQSFWEESIFTSKWKKVKTWTAEETEIEQTPDDLSNVYNALKIGLHDYVTKNKFPGVIIGMSGGIDS